MQRDFQRLAGGSFDILVIGGGVYGSWIAYDAALRGLRVALIERRDWASATSSASSKLIHGGLRYLEHAQLRLVRKALAERARLARLAPHRVLPLRFVLPVYADDRVGRLRLRLGLWLYDRLAGPGQPVEPHRTLSATDLVRRFELKPGGLLGGFTFGDCQTDDARFTLEIVDGAVGAGAVAVNRARARSLLTDGSRVVGATVEDLESGISKNVRAALTVDCTGPWSHRLSVDGASAIGTRLTRGVHLVMPPLPVDEAFLLTSNDDRRVIFLIPWYGRTLLGTTDTDYRGNPDDVKVEPHDVTYLLTRANRVLGGPPWTEADVIGSFAGLRTLPVTPGVSPSAVSREWVLTAPSEGLLSAVGGKYTSARTDAAIAVDRAQRALGREISPCPTEERPFPWAPPRAHAAWSREMLRQGLALGMDEETIESCLLRFGSRIEGVFERIRSSPELALRIMPDTPFCLAEVVYAVTNEMARSLEDVLRRRIPLLLVSRPRLETLRTVAALVARHLGWSDARRRAELDALVRPAAPTPTHEPA